ncbi:MAG: ketopantoate reductase family protein [Gemmatimonadaceae bacterium]
MRTLVVGAGGIGGYFGGRMLQAGRDVTFLVRPRRAQQLATRGLIIKSQKGGDYHHPNPPAVQAGAVAGPYDLILLSCKAFDLEDAIASFAPAVGPNTAILPMLNGMLHMDALRARFGDAAVLGGLCFIAATLSTEGEVQHLNPNQGMVFGEPDKSRSARITAIEAEMAACSFDSRLSLDITQDMWEKWVFIGTGAGLTCLLRASVGDIEAAGGAALADALLAECAAIATESGFPPSQSSIEHGHKTFTAPGSTLTASMYRDLTQGGRTECEHVLGDLLRRGKREHSVNSILRMAYTSVAAYEVGRARAAAAKG